MFSDYVTLIESIVDEIEKKVRNVEGRESIDEATCTELYYHLSRLTTICREVEEEVITMVSSILSKYVGTVARLGIENAVNDAMSRMTMGTDVRLKRARLTILNELKSVEEQWKDVFNEVRNVVGTLIRKCNDIVSETIDVAHRRCS